jgi:ribose transport system substrate-binding protein
MKLAKSLLFAFAIILVIAGCGSKSNSGGSASPSQSAAPSASAASPSASASDAAASPSAANGAKKKIAVLLWSRGFEFMVALDQAIEEEAKKQGVEVTVLDGQAKSEVQIAQIEDSISKKVDLIILAPANSDELVPGVKKANDAGIPVITVDSVVSKGANIAASIAFNNKEAGQTIAKYLTDTYKTGKALELTGAQGTYHAVLRGGGFDEGMKASKGWTVITKNAEWSSEKSQNITADSLTAMPDITAIFTHNDDMQNGVLSGLRQVSALKKPGEKGYISLVAVDGTPEALQRIRDGKEEATINQDPFLMGSLAVKTAADVLAGKQVPAQQLTPPTLVTKANVDDPNLWGNKFKK